jgi:NAD(P)-dependent dehydrogenase (short-subunit alcohol dehydrogenase family)
MTTAIAPSFSLSGRKVLITGAGGGIGAETARVCAALGADVVVADRDAPEPLAQALRALGHQAVAVGFDVRDRAATEATVARFGLPDAVVINAGICPWDDWLDPGWDAVFDEVIDVNVKGVLHLTRAVLPGMMARGSGKLVIISSLVARNGGLRASPHYIASKGGVSAMVKWFARKAAPSGVCVNAICPGPIETPMTADQQFDLTAIPMGRLGLAREIAEPAAFLCGDGARYMTGATLDVNGGAWV